MILIVLKLLLFKMTTPKVNTALEPEMISIEERRDDDVGGSDDIQMVDR